MAIIHFSLSCESAGTRCAILVSWVATSQNPAIHWSLRFRRRGTLNWEEIEASVENLKITQGRRDCSWQYSMRIHELVQASDYEVQLKCSQILNTSWSSSQWINTENADICPKADAKAFVDTLGIGEQFFNSQHDRCYCRKCYIPQFPDTIASESCERGESNSYVIPRGWVRFGLELPPRAKDLGENFFKKWIVSFHGTSYNVCEQILKHGMFLLPGDRLMDGSILMSERCAGEQPSAYFTSPTVCYAGLRFYAKPNRFKDVKGRPMLGQVLLPVGYCCVHS